MGRRLEVADIVEGVFLSGFEAHQRRPGSVRLGEWLVNLIEPTVRAIAAHPDAELQNIGMARSAIAAPARTRP
jgi:hypothetical protein